MSLHFLKVRFLKHIFLCAVFMLMFKPDAFSQFINTNPLAAQSDPSIYYDYNYSDSKTEFQPKNPRTAFLLSYGITLGAGFTGYYQMKKGNTEGGAWILGLGLLLGPSTGNIYAHNSLSVIKGISTRFWGGIVGAGGAYLGVMTALISYGGGPRIQIVESSAYFLFFGGAAMIVYSTIYDFINAPGNVKKYNNAQRKKLSINPVYNPVHNSVGLSMNLRF